MENHPIYAISPLDGRYHDKLTALRTVTSEYGLLYFRTEVEIRWLQHLANQRDIIKNGPNIATDELNEILSNFDQSSALRIKEIESTTNHDVKSVEYYIKECITQRESLQALLPFIHFACTSEDINNLAYGLMIKAARHTLNDALQQLQQPLRQMSEDYADVSLLARTHGQPASPTTLGKELFNIVARLQSQQDRLHNTTILGKFNGAVGNYNAHVAAFPNVDWPKLNRAFVESLGLEFNPHTTQIEPHDYLADIMHNIMRINTILIDCTRDVWQYISQGYFTQQKKDNEVGSSTMPHKINPIDFENAEGNLGMANAVAGHLANKLPISRLQRDLSDSTVLRNLGVVCGHSLLAYQSLQKGLVKLDINRERIRADLLSHWELLAEPIQTVLRANGVTDAYEQLKTLTRGTHINEETIREFIQSLDINDADKSRLLALTPENYIGLATQLVEDGL